MGEIRGDDAGRAAREDRRSPLRCPVLFLALAFAFGVFLAGSDHASPDALSQSIPVTIFAASLCLLTAALLVRVERERTAAAVTLTGFVLVGVAASLLFSFRFPPDHISNLERWGIDSGRPLSVEGRLVSECVPMPTGCEFDLELARLKQNSGEREVTMRPASGKVRLTTIAAFTRRPYSKRRDTR